MRRKLCKRLLRAELDNASVTSALIGVMIVLASVVAVGLIVGSLPAMLA